MPKPTETFSSVFSSFNEAYEKKDYKTAITVGKKTLNHSSAQNNDWTFVFIYLRLGSSYHALQLFDKASGYYKAALKLPYGEAARGHYLIA